MSQLIILRGNSGSGKTTTARCLQEAIGRNTMVISQDLIRRNMLHAKDGEATFALPLLKELLRYGHTNCQHVILEGILKASWYYELFELANELFDDIHAFYYDIPFEATLESHQQRDKVNEFGEEHMRSWWNDKDFMQIIPEISLTEEMSQNQIVQMILDKIAS